MVGDAERRVLGGGQGGRVRGVGRGGQRPGEPAEPRLPGQRRQPAEVGEGGGLDLAEQRVGPQQVALRRSGSSRSRSSIASRPARARSRPTSGGMGRLRWNRSSRRGGGLEGGLVRPLGEDDLAGDGQAERVAGRARLDDVEDRPGRRPQRRGQAAAGRRRGVRPGTRR